MGEYKNSLQWTIFFVLFITSILAIIYGEYIVKVLGVILLILILSGIRVIFEYERGVLFTLGRYTGLLGPGLIWVIPVIQYLEKVSLRIQSIDIQPQEVITKDNIPVKVNGVAFFRVEYPEKAILNVENYKQATVLYAQTVLRDVIGDVELDELLQKRDEISERIRKIVDEITDAWGVDVTSVKIQDIIIPEDIKRAIARQAEAERERRAVIILSEGEIKAAENLQKAAKILSEVPESITLRVLHTLAEISTDPNQKVIILFPTDLLKRKQNKE